MARNQTPIENLGLGTRAERALRKLGVATVAKLLDLDASQVLRLHGCGHGVYERLVSAQKRLCAEQGRNSSPRGAALTYHLLRFGGGSWVQRCLDELGVKNLYDLASVSFLDFLDLHGFGLNTWTDISVLRRHAIRALGGLVVRGTRKVLEDPADLVRRPPTEQSIALLPLFSDLESEFFGNPLYHPAWRSGWQVSDLTLTVRAFSLLRRTGVKDVGQLLLLPGATFLTARNSHFGTLRKVHEALRTLLLGGIDEKQKHVDYTDFKRMVSSWLAMALGKTLVNVASRRFQVENERFVTYDRISKEFGITRARVGQIWESARFELKRQQNLVLLDRFWRAVDRALQGDSLQTTRLAASLARIMNWPENPPEVALRELLGLYPGFAVTRHGAVVRPR